MEKVLFTEEQRFTQWWLWLLLIASFGVPIIILAIELVQTESSSEDYIVLLFAFCLLVALIVGFIWFFLKIKLVTEVRGSSIRFRFPPLHNKWKQISKEEIESYEVRRYRPVREYGGWGIKSNWRKRNTAYNVSGNIGLQFHLKSGKNILLGTQKKQAIEHAMKKLMQLEGHEEK